MVAGPALRHGALLLLVVCAAVLLLANLGGQDLWQDEAQTALIAGTVLEHGRPLGTDGRNFFSQELGAEYGRDHVWRWHTWFPFYLLAGFFAVLGKSTFSARLPFALLGVATVACVVLLAERVFRSRRAGVIAGLLLLTSVPFLVLSRQCRYYSAAALFSVLALHAYLLVLDRGRRASWVFVAASVLLFHTHYLYFAALLAAVTIDALALRRDAWKRVVLLSAVAVGLCLPWIVWLSGMSYGARYGSSLMSPGKAGAFGSAFVRQLGKEVFPPLLLAAVAVLALLKRPRGGRRPDSELPAWKRCALPVLFVVITLVALSLSAPYPFFRYLAPVLPVCVVLMAGIVDAVMTRQVWIGTAVLVSLVLWQPLGDYLHEITHDFNGPVEGIVRYLNAHGKPSDVVAITYDDLPLKFYTRMRVVGGLTGEDLGPARDAEWVIVRKHVISDKDQIVRQYLARNVPWQKYERIEVDSPDTAFENREDPGQHRFRTATGEDRVVIYRRVEP